MKTTIRVNRKRPESMTKQITDQLTGLIESGVMSAGEYLPSSVTSPTTRKVARNVVRGSYENLMKAGRVQSEGRKGRTVRLRRQEARGLSQELKGRRCCVEGAEEIGRQKGLA